MPTSRATLRPSHECVFNNMKWLSEEEQQKRSMLVTASGLDWVHPSVSNEVAQSLHVQGLNAQVAAEALALADGGDLATWFEAAGQQEPRHHSLSYLHLSLSLSLSLYLSIYLYLSLSLSLSVYIYIYIYTHTLIYIYIYTHIH